MANTFQWTLDLSGRVFTNLLGSVIPVSILWEMALPPPSADPNAVMELIEGTIGVVGYLVMASLVAVTLNEPQIGWSSNAPALVMAPFFLPSSIEKLRRFRRLITDAFTPSKGGNKVKDELEE